MTRSEAARTNGPLSHGPATPEGKAPILAELTDPWSEFISGSSYPGESQAEFDALLASVVDHWIPETEQESDLVFEIAASRWRMRRLIVMEQAVIETEMERIANDKENPVASPSVARVKAFAAVASGPAMKQIHRYENRLRRASEKAQKELDAVQQERYTREQMIREAQSREEAARDHERIVEENYRMMQEVVRENAREQARRELDQHTATTLDANPSDAQNDRAVHSKSPRTEVSSTASERSQNEPVAKLRGKAAA